MIYHGPSVTARRPAHRDENDGAEILEQPVDLF